MSTSSVVSLSALDRAITRAPRPLCVVPVPAPVTARGASRKRPPRAPALRPVRPQRVAVPPESRELLRDLELDAGSLARNLVPLGECTRAGRWVDVATGKVIVEHRDLALGTVPQLTFTRVWLSCSTYRGPLGHGWHHDYDLALAHGAESVALRLSGGRVVWLRAPPRGGVSYDADERLGLARDRYGFVLRDSSGAEHRFVPHRARAAFVLGSSRARDGHELSFGYDHRARLVHVAHRGGLDLELEYNADDRIVEICGPDPQHTRKRVALARFAYDSRGNLCKASDALGQARRYAYAGTLLGTLTDRNGCSAHFEWDAVETRARCVHVRVDSALQLRRLEYRPGRTHVRNSLGAETAYSHEGGFVHRVVDARGHTREIARGPSGRLEGEIDELGQRWHRVYDARGNLIECRGPDGMKCSFEYDANDRVERAIDAMGGRWELDHDRRGRLARLVDPLGHATRFHHRGRWLVGVTDANGHHTAFAYDDAGNLAAWVAPGGATTRYAYDAWGQLVRITDAQGSSQIREYDVLGRLLRIHEPDGNCRELAYDAEGNLTRWKDQQRDIQFTYHGTGRISSRSEAGHTLCFEYDTEEQLIGVVDEFGQVLHLQRDALGRIVETVGFDGRVQRYPRDALGRVVRIERAAEFSEYDYDAAGRVVEVQHSDGAFEGFRYRADGALISAWNECVTLGFEHDALGRVTAERLGEHVVEYAYDGVGRLAELRSSSGARQVFEREAAGPIRRTTELASGFESSVVRDVQGHEVERSFPGGARSAWQRDAMGRPCAYRLETEAGAVLHKVVYEWEPGSRLRRRTDLRRGPCEYYYDTRGNLAWAHSAGRYEVRMPDATGNLFGREDRRDRAYGAAGQLLQCSTRSGELRYRCDSAGNRIERRSGSQTQRYAWSASGCLKAVMRADGDEVRFGYDPLGRRVWKKYRGQTTRWLWAGSTLLHEWVEGELSQPSAASAPAEVGGRVATLVLPPVDSPESGLAAALDASVAVRGSRQAPITWLCDPDTGTPLAKLTAAGAFAIVCDHAGTPRWMLDGRSRVVWDAESSITGALRLREGQRHACLARLSGTYEDLETGLYYGGRYYDPDAGVYVNSGSIAAPPTLRAYAFAPEPRAPAPTPAHQWLADAALPSIAVWPGACPAPLAMASAPPVSYPVWNSSERHPGGWPVPRPAAVSGSVVRMHTAVVEPGALVAHLVCATFQGS